MYTFSKKLEGSELAFIGIDCFESQLLNCTTFFLSHIHKDHMRGIHDVFKWPLIILKITWFSMHLR